MKPLSAQVAAMVRAPAVSRLFVSFVVAAFLALAALGGALLAPAALAQTGTYNPDTPADPATEARLKNLALELRCLVCQNQTIADSNADLAVDLRREVRDQIVKGRTDAEIKKYLVERYGDFVLYNPPVQANTSLLWFGPFALLALGAGVWWVFIRRRSGAGAPAAVSAADEKKAKALLEDT
jgi:cytochrome c-type biogenesis protein CcmH